jgi:hypothetical protein
MAVPELPFKVLGELFHLDCIMYYRINAVERILSIHSANLVAMFSITKKQLGKCAYGNRSREPSAKGEEQNTERYLLLHHCRLQLAQRSESMLTITPRIHTKPTRAVTHQGLKMQLNVGLWEMRS